MPPRNEIAEKFDTIFFITSSMFSYTEKNRFV